MAEYLEAVYLGQIQNLAINIQPRMTKSTLVSICFQPWVWTKRPESRWMCGSYIAKLATRDTRKSRNLIQSDWYQRRWGDLFSIVSDQNEKMEYENSVLGNRLAIGVGGGATGQGCDFQLLDDPQNEKKMGSKDYRKETWEWVSSTMATRLNDQGKSGRILVMQRTHEDDISGRIHKAMEADPENWGDWKFVKLATTAPAARTISFPLTNRVKKIKAGELLCEGRQDEKATRKLRASLGKRKSAAQLDQDPLGAKGTVLKRDEWRYYQELPTRDDLKGCQLLLVDSWDTAYGKTQQDDFTAQFTALVVAYPGKERLRNLFILDHHIDHMQTPDIIARLETTIPERERWAIDRYAIKFAHILVEDKANGIDVILQLKRIKKFGRLVTPINPTTDKIARAHGATPNIERGDVMLPDPDYVEGAEWVPPFVTNCAEFPEVDHDDDVDAFTQLVNWAFSDEAMGIRIR